MEIGVDIEGFGELVQAMDALPGLVAERVQGDGLIAVARVVRDEAKVLVPVRTGALRASIRTRRVAARVSGKRVAGAAARVVAGGAAAPHAALVEYGTVRAPAHPYLEPALLGTQTRQLAAAGAAMARSFIRIGRALEAGTTTRIVRRLAAE